MPPQDVVVFILDRVVNTHFATRTVHVARTRLHGRLERRNCYTTSRSAARDTYISSTSPPSIEIFLKFSIQFRGQLQVLVAHAIGIRLRKSMFSHPIVAQIIFPNVSVPMRLSKTSFPSWMLIESDNYLSPNITIRSLASQSVISRRSKQSSSRTVVSNDFQDSRVGSSVNSRYTSRKIILWARSGLAK